MGLGKVWRRRLHNGLERFFKDHSLFSVFMFKRGDINAMAGSNQRSLVMIGGTLANELPWTKLIKEELVLSKLNEII